MRASNELPKGYLKKILDPNFPAHWKKGLKFYLRKQGYDFDDKNSAWGNFMKETQDKI